MKPVTPVVEVIGRTDDLLWINGDRPEMELADATPIGTGIIEYAGRNCYQSFDKPNPATAGHDDYIKNIIGQNHYSVLEHANATFYIGGVSRNFTHELVRHRHLSFSELSGRYVDPFKAGLGYVVPPSFEDAVQWLAGTWEEAEANYYDMLRTLADKGVTGKKAREAARSILPGSLESRIVVTGNLRSWLEFVSKRDHPAADAEMQRVAASAYDYLMRLYPSVFAPDVRELWDAEFSQGEVKHGS